MTIDAATMLMHNSEQSRLLPLNIEISKNMTIDKARELLATQVSMGGGYNRNGAKLILAEIEKLHGQPAMDKLIVELGLEAIFGFKPGEKIFV